MDKPTGIIAARALGSCAALALAAGLLPAAAQAQESEAAEVDSETIIVTARKRDEALQDVPISLQVLSGDTLQNTAVLRASELQFAVPGFYVQNFETRATITLRVSARRSPAGSPRSRRTSTGSSRTPRRPSSTACSTSRRSRCSRVRKAPSTAATPRAVRST